MFVRIYSQPGESIPQSFEGFIEQVSHWEGMFAELDGSWVWVFQEGDKRYQLDGMLYDRAGGIEYVEIKGRATRRAWEQICNLLLDDFQRSSPDAFERHLRVHDIEQQCWRSPCDPDLYES
jgi:hypothetical protein